jgi:hypothetical protein
MTATDGTGGRAATCPGAAATGEQEDHDGTPSALWRSNGSVDADLVCSGARPQTAGAYRDRPWEVSDSAST